MSRSLKQKKCRIIFITGTDTGVGKTVFTGLLLHHFRTSGCHALAMKPFCSGNRADVNLLKSLQDGELTVDEINPYYFLEPVAPLVSTRKYNRVIRLSEVLQHIKKNAERCECLLIEGSGGLLVPLGENFLVCDLIQRLNCEVVVIARNSLGTLNHTLLTVNALKNVGIRRIKIVLMANGRPDASSVTNKDILSQILSRLKVYRINFLGKKANKKVSLKNSSKKIKKTLARISD